ncbi:hypothetical protein PHPALM_19778 [Phytophthora palmivora]|uniref:ZSWIM1/3 RNaseH-like domain-containing protein n=1 Tax=Phytophthora palmivora TaxID=4796 RepID=A0A2P4XGJ2_9STRA|nr:hypothetical protein PHPALM_19778 [Phytophthora palmivora]
MEEEEKTSSHDLVNVGDCDSKTEEQTHATIVPDAHEEDGKHEDKSGKLNEDEEQVEGGEDEAEGADEEDESAGSDVQQDTSDRESAAHTSDSEKRKRSSLRVAGNLHCVSVMKKQHASREDFDEYLKKYGKKYSTKMVIEATLSTELRNKRIMKQRQFVEISLSKTPFAPNSFGPFRRVYICTHGRKKRSRSSGKRSLQNTLWTGCGARFLAELTESDGKWIVEVKRDFYNHNHEVCQAKYLSHPGIRQVRHGSPVLGDVKVMVNAGGKATCIYDYICSTTPHRVTMGDVSNMIEMIRKAAIEHFQAINEWDRTQVVLVDKDFNEVEVLKRMPPNYRILVCHFHVIKWLKKAIRDDKTYGTYESNVLKQMEVCISYMVYSRQCWNTWITLPNFKTLNTRNESDELWRYFNMQQCITCILNFQHRKEDTYKIKTLLPGSTWNANYEYQFATNPDLMQRYSFIDTGFGMNIVRDDSRYHVDKTNWLCNCEFSLTVKMHCRHVILYRKHIGNVLTIPYARSHPGMFQVLPMFESCMGVPGFSQVLPMHVLKAKKSADDKFEDAVENLETWWNCLRHSNPNVAATDACGFDRSDSHIEHTQDVTAEQDEKDEQIHGGSASVYQSTVKPFNEIGKVGRPSLNRARVDSKRHAEQKAYNQGKKIRKALGSEDVVEAVKYIQEHKPPLGELHPSLETFEVRFKRHTKKTMTVETREPPQQIMPFRLPASLVKIALKAVRKATKTIVENVEESTGDNAEQVVVTIEDAGEFLETTLKAMDYLGNLSSTCKQGMQWYSWQMGLIEHMVALKGGKSDRNADGESEPLTVAKDIYST